MRFLLDQGLPRTTAQHLIDLGYRCEHVAMLGMATASDHEILAEALSRNAIVVTQDSDFHSILARSNADSPSVIRIRIQGLKGQALSELIVRAANVVGEELIRGAAVTITSKRLAVRELPLFKPARRPSDDDAESDGD